LDPLHPCKKEGWQRINKRKDHPIGFDKKESPHHRTSGCGQDRSDQKTF
jgi:hypothetical protein